MRHLAELDPTSEYVLGLEELADRLDGLTYAEIPEGTLNRGHFALSATQAPFRPLFSLSAQGGIHDYAAADATYVSWTSTDGRRTVGDPASGPSVAKAEVEFTSAISFVPGATVPWVWLTANVNVERVTNRKIVGLASPTFVAISIEVLVGSSPSTFSWATIGISERWMHPESVVLGANYDDTHFDVPISTLWRPTSPFALDLKGFRLRVSIVEPNTSPATVVRLNRWSFSGMLVRRGAL